MFKNLIAINNLNYAHADIDLVLNSKLEQAQNILATVETEPIQRKSVQLISSQPEAIKSETGKFNSKISDLSNEQLLAQTKKIIQSERKITHLILQHINEIEDRKIHLSLGYDGMYSYLTRGLGYSESAAYRRMQSARLLRKAPELSAKIQNGSLNLSQMTVLNKSLAHFEKNLNSNTTQSSNQDVDQNSDTTQSAVLNKLCQVAAQIEHKNAFETEKVLAQAFDLPITKAERIKPQQDDSIRMEIILTAEQFAVLKQAQSLLSHTCPGGSIADVIATLAQNFVDKKMKSPKAEPNVIAKELTQAATAMAIQENKKPYRQYISVHTKRSLLQKANHCCEYVDHKTQQRCNSKYQLEIDHIQPLSLGGSDDERNLRILCRVHNNARNKGII